LDEVDEYVYFSYYTPDMGNLSLNWSPIQRTFKEALIKKSEKIRVVCLSPLGLYEFYKRYSHKHPDAWKKAVFDACHQSAKIYRSTNEKNNSHPAISDAHSVRFIDFENLTMHFVISEKRSIIINTLNLPPQWGDFSGIGSEVDIVGQESTDSYIRNRLKRSFEIFWKHITYLPKRDKGYLKLLLEMIIEKQDYFRGNLDSFINILEGLLKEQEKVGYKVTSIEQFKQNMIHWNIPLDIQNKLVDKAEDLGIDNSYTFRDTLKKTITNHEYESYYDALMNCLRMEVETDFLKQLEGIHLHKISIGGKSDEEKN
jgi:hypothetical protein